MPDVATPPAPPAAPAAPKPSSTPAPSSFPAPGPARAGFYAAIEKKAQGATTAPAKPADAPKPAAPKPAPKEPVKVEPSEATEVETDEFSDATPTTTEPRLADEPKAAEAVTTPQPKDAPKDKKGKEPGPWALKKLAEDRALHAERELEQYRKAAPNAERLKKQQEEFQAIQKRNEELESEIRFVSYTKSKDFVEKYQKPYDEAWQTAMNDLAEIPVTDGNGTRALVVDDIAQLVYMPLARAKEEAVAKFGSFADDVMAARKEIRRLGEHREKALEQAKTTAAEREKQLTDQWNTRRSELKTEIAKNWQEANDGALNHPQFGHYFKPTDGDDAGNTSLEKGFKIVDEAFAVNVADPKLTPEQRAAAVRKQVAVRNRAAAFGRLTLQLGKATARVKELEAKVAELEGGEPSIDGRNGAAAPMAPVKALDRLHAAIEKAAK